MRNVVAVVCTAILSSTATGQLTDSPIIRYQDLAHPTLGSSGMVAAQNSLSAQAGAEVLADGGNAAVAVGFSLAVTLPRAGNLGGGGFMLIHDAANGDDVAIDYREMAPLKATRDMYLDEKGDVDPTRSKFSHLASGVPGTVRVCTTRTRNTAACRGSDSCSLPSARRATVLLSTTIWRNS